MFGITTFAQAPFASLGNAFYPVVEIETLTATQTANTAFLAAQTNTITLTDTNVSQFAFLGETSDLFVITTVDSVLAQFNVVNIDSLVTLSDFQYARGWFKINDNQTVTWGAINNTQ